MARIKAKRKAKTQWEREGISRTTWYRRKRHPSWHENKYVSAGVRGALAIETDTSERPDIPNADAFIGDAVAASDMLEPVRQSVMAEHLNKMYFGDRQATLEAAKAGPPPRDFEETEQARIEREVDAQVSMRVQGMEGERDKALVGEFVRVFSYCNRTLDARETITLGWLTAAAVCRALVKAGY